MNLWLGTAGLAIASSLLALSIGVPLGYWLASLRAGARRFAQSSLLVPFLLPAFLVGGFLINLVGRDALASNAWVWLVVAHALMNVGFIGAVTSSGLLAVERELIEDAQLAGAGRLRLAVSVELPILARSIVGAALLVTIYSSTSYGLVLMLGGGEVATLETAIGQAALQRLAIEEAAWLAAGQLLLTCIFVAPVLRMGAGGSLPLFGGLSGHPRRTGALAKAVGWGSTASILVLLATLLLGAFRAGGNWQSAGGWTLVNFANLSGRGARDLLNLTIAEATVNSLRNLAITMLIALPVSWWLAHPRNRFSTLSVIPLGVSPVVMGLLGLIALGWLTKAGLPFELQWLLLPVFQAVFVIPVLLQLLAPARASLEAGLLEAANLDGANRAQRLIFVTLPLLLRPITVALAIGSLATLGEFGTASFLSFGSQATLSVSLGRLLSHPGAENLGMFSAVAAILVLVSWLLLLFLAKVDATGADEIQR